MEWVHNFSPLVGFALNILLIFWVLKRHLHSRTHQIFALFLFAMGCWALTTYGMRVSPLEKSLPWERAIIGILPFMAVSFYHFVLLLTKRTVKYLPPWVGYLLAFGAVTLAPSDLLLAGMQSMWYGNGLIQGPLLPFYAIVFYGYVIFAAVLLVKAYASHHTLLERTRYIYIGFGAILCLGGLFADILAARGVPIYPLGILSNIFFSIICTYSILKYRLLDVRLVIRKGTAYFLTSTIGLAFFVAVLFIAYFFINRTWTLPIWLNAIVILLISLGLQPNIKWAQKLVDKLFYRDRYDFLKALDNLGAETKLLTDLPYIAASLTRTVAAAMRCQSVAVMLPDASEKYFVSVSSEGQKEYASVKLAVESAIPWQLKETGDLLHHADFNINPQLKALSEKERNLVQSLDIRLFVPLISRESLKGIMILGPKLSDQEYSSEELSLLRVVSRQMSAILDNARLYELQSKRIQEQTLLTRLGLIVSSQLDIKKVCGQFIDELRNVMPIDYAGMFNLDEGKTLQLACMWSRLPGLSALEDTISSKVPRLFNEIITRLETSEKLINRHGYDVLFKGSVLDKAGLKSLICLPLHMKQEVAGFIIFGAVREQAYSEDNALLLQQVAMQLGIARDNTRLYELERESRKELERQYQERTDFVNSLIHEVKTPLTAMIASTELLKDYYNVDSKLISDVVENLDVSANNLNVRISELVDFIRLQSTQIKLNLKHTDLNELATRAASHVMGLLNSRNQALQVDLPQSLGRIKGDPDRIMQILLNLLTNASKFSGARAKLVMKTYAAEGSAVFELKDAAPPIAQSRLAKIFDPYNRLKGDTSGGLGLGLSICKHLVELHGGHIWVEPDTSGNTFRFSIPLARKSAGVAV
jgi:two-component system clock-associated histidine kinase SasA